ncbi:MAG: ribonuclease HII [Haloechinothrix sp.]
MPRSSALGALEPRPPRVPIRRDTGSWGLQAALDRRGLGPVAGVDEAGRGACAGPLVVAACVLRPGDAARLPELTDSKLLTPAARERVYDRVVARAQAYSVVVIPTEEVDADGVHHANVAGMRRAIAMLDPHPGYVLTDGFPVPGLTAPSVPIIKGDQAAACVAAASVLAKVTRDRIMTDLHSEYPRYGFDVHKGYITTEHGAALSAHGPSVVHRWSFANVAVAALAHGRRPPRRVLRSVAAVRATATEVPDELLESLRACADAVRQNGMSATAGLEASGTEVRLTSGNVGGTPTR